MTNAEIDAKLAQIDALAKEVAAAMVQHGPQEFFCFAGRCFRDDARTIDVVACTKTFLDAALARHGREIVQQHEWKGVVQ